MSVWTLQAASFAKRLLLSDPRCQPWTHAQSWPSFRQDAVETRRSGLLRPPVFIQTLVFVGPTQKITGRVSAKTNTCYLNCV